MNGADALADPTNGADAFADPPRAASSPPRVLSSAGKFFSRESRRIPVDRAVAVDVESGHDGVEDIVRGDDVESLERAPNTFAIRAGPLAQSDRNAFIAWCRQRGPLLNLLAKQLVQRRASASHGVHRHANSSAWRVRPRRARVRLRRGARSTRTRVGARHPARASGAARPHSRRPPRSEPRRRARGTTRRWAPRRTRTVGASRAVGADASGEVPAADGAADQGRSSAGVGRARAVGRRDPDSRGAPTGRT